MQPSHGALLLLGLLAASLTPGPAVASAAAGGLCTAEGACAEADVEQVEEIEASALRVELLQQRSRRSSTRAAVGALGEVTTQAAVAQPPTPPEEPAGGESLTETPPDDDDYSDEGPFDEEPDDLEAAHPRPAMANWSVSVDPQASLLGWGDDSGWGSHPGWGPGHGTSSSFCQTHHTGFFCMGTTRTRCCRRGRFYTQCGSTQRSSACGWHGGGGGWHGGGGGYHPGYPGGYHPGWHPWAPPGGYDHYCQEHHTGNFCSHHTRISCCRRGWLFVSCTTTSRSHSYC